jgi:hypothetical protein
MDDEEAIIQAVFIKFTGGADTLSSSQFANLLNALSKRVELLNNVSIEQASALINFLAARPDIGLTFHEFNLWWRMSDRYSFLIGEKATLFHKAYKLYKKYAKNDSMTFQEFEYLISELNLRVSDDAFDRIDKNDDGLVDFAEFCKWLNWF